MADDWGAAFDTQVRREGGDVHEVSSTAAVTNQIGLMHFGGGGFVAGATASPSPQRGHGYASPTAYNSSTPMSRGGYQNQRRSPLMASSVQSPYRYVNPELAGQAGGAAHSQNRPPKEEPIENQLEEEEEEEEAVFEVRFDESAMSPEDIALINKYIHRSVNHMKNATVQIQKQQADPESPLHSVMNFRELRLSDSLLKALDVMGFHQPSKIQEFALPLLLSEPPTNMIAQSQSGTGKTAAFSITMLSRVDGSQQVPQALCLAPTYELAMQIGEVVSKMAQFMPDIKVHYAVKGAPRLPPGTKITEQIIIGTPGKVLDYVCKFSSFDPSLIGCLVLDEADVMISQQGHLDLSMRIYNTIETANPGVQALLFSATYDKPVMDFAEKIIKNHPVSVTLRREEQALPNIKQHYVECANRDAKYDAILNLYSGLTIASAIIFCKTRQSATWLATRLAARGHEVALLHGELTVLERAQSIQAFKDGVHKVLITTNVCARGIDVSQVSIVINYDPPIIHDTAEPDYDTYLHRIGRTGRFGKAGIAINFVDSRESLNVIKKIEAHFAKPIAKLDPSDIDQLEAIERD